MTIAVEFAYARPDTLDEALAILARHDGEAMILAGGTDLVPWLRDDLISPHLVVDIKQIPGLDILRIDDGVLTIGALVTFADLVDAEVIAGAFPMLAEAAATVGSVGIRHRATLVGNICSAVPSCDSGPPLLVHEATVHTIGLSGVRSIPISDWFTGPKRTALGAGELVTHTTLAVPGQPTGAAFARLSRYSGEDLAQASVAVRALPDGEWRVAFGALAPAPVRASAIEAALSGRSLDAEAIEAAIRLVPESIAPITDMRASREYRLAMAAVMLRRALQCADARRAGSGPPYGTALL